MSNNWQEASKAMEKPTTDFKIKWVGLDVVEIWDGEERKVVMPAKEFDGLISGRCGWLAKERLKK